MGMDNESKAVSPVVTVALLLVVAVTAVVAFQGWFQTFSSELFQESEQVSQSVSGTNIADITGGELYMEVSTSNNLSVKTVKVDGETCDISTNLSSGVSSLDISSCLDNASGSTEVSVVSEQGVISQETYINTDEVASTSPSSSIRPDLAFKTTWQTNESGVTNNQSIRLPLTSSGTYDFTVEWGDGTNDTITSWNQAEVTHDYGTKGTYNVTITGTLEGFRFAGNVSGGDPVPVTDARKLQKISQWGGIHLGDGGAHFRGAEHFQITASDAPNLTGVQNYSEMFQDAQALNADLSHWNVSGATDMSYMFETATEFNGSLHAWDTSQVTDMKNMFRYGYEFDKDISSWDVGAVENMDEMFLYTYDFNHSLNSWDVSNVEIMSRMFYGAGYDKPLQDWDTSDVRDMSGMFQNTYGGFDQNISSWNTSKVTNMENMFSSNDNFNYDISSWDVSSVTDMRAMFYGHDTFNQSLASWNVSSVASMRKMFGYTEYDNDISSWEVEQVTDCQYFDSDTPDSWTSSEKPNFTNCSP